MTNMKLTTVAVLAAALSNTFGAISPEAKRLSEEAVKAWLAYDDPLFLEKYNAALKADPQVAGDEYFRARLTIHRRALEDAKRFPLAEKEIGFGKTLKTMGVAEKKTVHMTDFWNPTNVTAALQKLIDDPEVTTIVFDRTPTPWYIGSVKIGYQVTGKRILLKSGAKILKCPWFLRYRLKKGRGPGPIFDIESAQNLIIESDAARPEEVLIGCYATYAERAKYTKEYGQSAFNIGHKRGKRPTKSVVLRNLLVANTEEDGLCVACNWDPPENIYVENVVFDSNFRQGCSPCVYYSLYFKGCTFRNTRGAPPSAGVDVEPWTDNLATANLYFFDCTFANNGGGALGFATATRDPVLCLAKRCRFLPTPGAQFFICARPTNYIEADRKPLSNIILEDCEFDSTHSTIEFEPCPIYDVTLRNCVIRDARSEAKKRRAAFGPPVIRLALNRNFGKPDLSDNLRPKVVFDNVRIEGFENSEPLGVSDEIGMLNISKVFFGTVNWNGKSVDLSKVTYKAPDVDEPKTAFVPAAKLLKPSKVPAADEAMPESNAQLCFNGAWWLKGPCQSYYFWAEKGRAVNFDFRVNYPKYYKHFPTNTLFITSASGKDVKLADVTKGTVNLRYVAHDTGWHRFSPGGILDKGYPIASGIEWFVTNVKGAYFAWQADTESDCFAKFFLKDGAKPYTGYFEVPSGGKPCRLRVSYGGFVLKDPAGNVVGSVKAGEYKGRHVFTITPSSDKAEIWSFTTPCTPDGGWTRGLRFYAPLNGIWADSPEMLPCEYAEHFVPAKQRVVEQKAVTVKLDTSKLSKETLKTLEKAKADRKAFAAKREYAGLKAKLEAQIAKMREAGMDDDTQHQIDDIMNAVNLHGRVSVMEKKAAAETPDVFEVAAFCQANLARLVTDVAPDSPHFAERLAEELHLFGLAAPEGFLEYDDPAKLLTLVDAILAQIGGR